MVTPFWKRSDGIVAIVSICVLLTTVFTVGHLHLESHRRYLVAVVRNQIDAHADKIADLLSELHGKPPSEIEDAVYDQLQRPPSTSLITREMVSVRESTNAVSECVINLEALGLPVRQIREAAKR